MNEYFKKFAGAIHDLVHMGGRLSDESYDFIKEILDKEVDSLKAEITEIVKGVLSDLTERVNELEDLLEEKSKKAAPVKKASN